MTCPPDLIHRSGRESLTINERIDLLRADVQQAPFTNVPERSVNQSIHDLKLTIGRIRSTIELYEQAKARGTTDAQLQQGADLVLSDTECLMLAWRRGGHLEYVRVQRAQRWHAM
jgi:hypothetical protein